MKSFNIRVRQKKHDEYPCFSFYTVEGHDEHDAKKRAKQRFQQDTGFKPDDSNAYILSSKQLNKQSKEE